MLYNWLSHGSQDEDKTLLQHWYLHGRIVIFRKFTEFDVAVVFCTNKLCNIWEQLSCCLQTWFAIDSVGIISRVILVNKKDDGYIWVVSGSTSSSVCPPLKCRRPSPRWIPWQSVAPFAMAWLPSIGTWPTHGFSYSVTAGHPLLSHHIAGGAIPTYPCWSCDDPNDYAY